MVVFQDLSTDFFENHFSEDTAQYLSFGFVLANFLGGFIAMPIIDRSMELQLFDSFDISILRTVQTNKFRIGRRPLYLVNYAISIICVTAYVIFDRVAFQYSWLRWPMIGSIALFSIVFGYFRGLKKVDNKIFRMALSPIAFSITTEMVAQKHRSIVQTMVFSTNTIMNFAFAFFVLPAFTNLTVCILYLKSKHINSCN